MDAITNVSVQQRCRPFTKFLWALGWRHGAAVTSFDVRVTYSSHSTSDPVNTWMGDRLRTVIPSRYVTSQLELGRLTFQSLRVANSSTSFAAGKGGNFTSVSGQVALCDPMWHVSSRGGECSCKLLYSVYLLTCLLTLTVRVSRLPMQSGTGGFQAPRLLHVVSIDVAELLSRWPAGHVTLTTDHRPVSAELSVRNNSR